MGLPLLGRGVVKPMYSNNVVRRTRRFVLLSRIVILFDFHFLVGLVGFFAFVIPFSIGDLVVPGTLSVLLWQ